MTRREITGEKVPKVPEIGRLGGRLPERKSTKKPESNDSEDGYRRESPPKCLKLDDSERGYWRESPQSA